MSILAILFALASFQGRRTLQGQEEAAFLSTLQNLFWQGATEAASRGENLDLVRTGNRLELRQGSRTLKGVDIPQGVALSIPEGTFVRFTPPGKLRNPQGNELTSPLTFTVSVRGRTYRYTLSLIGETKVEP